MTLERLDLKNFQCHRSLSIEFDPLITTLVGKTNSGKSAILRALRWLVQNFPAGDEFISDGEKYCRARLTVDGHRVVRRIGDRSEYRLDDKVYKAFGRNVPPAIAKLINLTDENFQSQLDAPFWFGLTPGQVAKELNRIVDLGVIDKTLANLAQVSRQATSEVALTKTRLQEAKQTRDKLAWVPAMGLRLKALQAKGKSLADKRQKGANLALLCQQANQLALAKQIALKRKFGAEAAYKAGAAWARQKQAVEELTELVDEVRRRKDETCRLKEQLAKAKQELQKATQGKRCPVCGNKFSPSSARTST